MSKSWKNVEVTKETWDELRPYLKKENIHYEVSGMGSGLHLEVEVDAEEQNQIDTELDRIYELV